MIELLSFANWELVSAILGGLVLGLLGALGGAIITTQVIKTKVDHLQSNQEEIKSDLKEVVNKQHGIEIILARIEKNGNGKH